LYNSSITLGNVLDGGTEADTDVSLLHVVELDDESPCTTGSITVPVEEKNLQKLFNRNSTAEGRPPTSLVDEARFHNNGIFSTNIVGTYIQ